MIHQYIKNLIFSLSIILFIDSGYATSVSQPTIGPMLGLPQEQTVRFWWCGPKLSQQQYQIIQNQGDQYYGAFSFKKNESTEWTSSALVKMEVYFDDDDKKDIKDLIAFIDREIDQPGKYDYRCGYFKCCQGEDPNSKALQWNKETVFTFSWALPSTRNLALGFGSCRYFAKVFGLTFGLQASDSIFKHINCDPQNENYINAFAFLGDYIYADSLSFFNNAKRYHHFQDLYQKAMTTPHFRKMIATIPSFNIRDDHETYNNAGDLFKQKYPDLYRASMQAYGSYQLMHTPKFTPEMNDPTGGYPLSFFGIPGFMLDTRNRTTFPERIISSEEMDTIKQWLLSHKDKPYKIIFSSVPMFPGYAFDFLSNQDKWLGFSQQINELLTHIDIHRISGVLICSGDIHKCAYAQIQTPQHHTIITNITASPLFWPYGHDTSPLKALQTETTRREFIKGYPFILKSKVYPTNAYARVGFIGNNQIDVRIINGDGQQINKDDPAGSIFNLIRK